MYLFELMFIMLMVLVIAFWLESMRVNEIARALGARVCRENNVQFLDDTVHVSSLKIGKNSHGQLKIIRKYKFEFTNNEHHRYGAELTLAGKQLIETYMDAYRFED